MTNKELQEYLKYYPDEYMILLETKESNKEVNAVGIMSYNTAIEKTITIYD